MRPLIYVPILHTESDLGSMAGEVRAKFVEAFGQESWARRASAIDAMWEAIRARLCSMALPWKRVRLYQDGLPICGHEANIVRQVAASGSRNHKLLLELMELGAELMGTEDPLLLVREYRRIGALAQAARERATPARVRELELEGDELLRARDAFIANRIDSTVASNECGVVLLGLMHRVDELVEKAFNVHHLIHRLPLGADLWRQFKEISKNGS